VNVRQVQKNLCAISAQGQKSSGRPHNRRHLDNVFTVMF